MHATAHHTPQTDLTHYGGEYYDNRRMYSLALQAGFVARLAPRTVLEIGPGRGVTAAIVRTLTGARVITLDVDPTLRPGVIGSIFALPLADRSVDVSACFQMLEHLPFDCFTPALAELRRVTAGAAVVSLPDCSLALTLRIGRLNPRRDGIVVCRTLQPAGWALRRFKTVPNAAGHYWEIGRKGTPLTVVRRAITAAGWRIESETRPAENAYHRFFVLR